MAGSECKHATGARSRAQYDEERRNSAHYFECEACGKHAHRDLGGSNIKNGYRNRFCSQVCRKDSLARARVVRDDLLLQEKIARKKVSAQREEDAQARQTARLASLALRPCAMCGKACGYVANGRPRRYCSDACAKKSPTSREAQKSGKGVRRARKRNGLTERFRVVDVFDRDGWRCQICGVSTPSSRRGTRHANAPELDHIVPISKGGAHTKTNAQCSCRSCNQWKSNTRVVGQCGLFS